MKLLDNFDKAKQELYDHVGFVEDWVIYPISNRFDMYWAISTSNKTVRYAETLENLKDWQREEFYEDYIYKQRFYVDHVYRGEKLTMVFCDTNVDNMKYFAFFDNEKELKNG